MLDNQASLTIRTCTKCNAPARLRIIIPSDKPGFDERLFECTACGHSETLLIAAEREA